MANVTPTRDSRDKDWVEVWKDSCPNTGWVPVEYLKFVDPPTGSSGSRQSGGYPAVGAAGSASSPRRDEPSCGGY